MTETNTQKKENGQELVNVLVGENITQKKAEQFFQENDLNEGEKKGFKKLIADAIEAPKKKFAEKIAGLNPMNYLQDKLMDNILNSEFIKAILAVFGIKEERFKELFRNLFNGEFGLQQAINNSFGRPPVNSPQFSEFMNYNNQFINSDLAGCKQFDKNGMTCCKNAYDSLLNQVRKGYISQEMFNYCISRNPVRQDMNQFFNYMKKELGEDLANVMMHMAKAESGLGTNILNNQASGAGGELQLIRANVLATGRQFLGLDRKDKSQDLAILKAYDEKPEFRNAIQAEFTKQMVKALRPPTAENLRSVWFLGPTAGNALVKINKEYPNMNIAAFFQQYSPKNWNSILKENNISPSATVADVYNKYIANAGFANGSKLDTSHINNQKAEVKYADYLKEQNEESQAIKM